MQAKARGEAPRVAQELGITKSLSHEMLIYQKKNRILNFDVTSKTFLGSTLGNNFSRLGTGAGGGGWRKFKLNVYQNKNENKNASRGTCEVGAKRPPVGCFTRCVFAFVLIYVEFEFSESICHFWDPPPLANDTTCKWVLCTLEERLQSLEVHVEHQQTSIQTMQEQLACFMQGKSTESNSASELRKNMRDTLRRKK